MPSKDIDVEERPNGSPPDLSGRRIDTLERKGSLHPLDRKRVTTNTGY